MRSKRKRKAAAFDAKASSKQNRHVASKLLLAAISTVLALGLAEIGLRAAGFSYHLYPEKIEFGAPWPEEIETNFLVDKDLFWITKDYTSKLETARSTHCSLIFMGCSCTQWGKYPEYFVSRIAARFPLNKLQCANLGVAGWTTHQGLEQLRRDILGIRPKVITLFYGWNDHWFGFGIQDKDVTRLHSSSPSSWVQNELRLGQLTTRMLVGLGAWKEKAFPLRVVPEDFRANLVSMVRLSGENGITPVLLTAPTSHEKGREPTYLKQRHIRNLADLVPLHQQYVSIVREVAKSEDVILCDLAAEFEKLVRTDGASTYFQNDGIHLKMKGDEKVACFLFECFEKAGLFERILE